MDQVEAVHLPMGGRRTPRVGDAVFVRWRDANAGAEGRSWVPHADQGELKVTICSSIGWLYVDDGDKICLTADLVNEDGGAVGSPCVIPVECVVEIRELDPTLRRKF